MKQRKWMSILLIVMLVVSMIPRTGIIASAAETEENIEIRETETQETGAARDSEIEQDAENKNTEDQQTDEEETEEPDGATEIPEDGTNPGKQGTKNKGEEKELADSDGLENPEKTEEVIGTDKTDESEETGKTEEIKEDEKAESVELTEETGDETAETEASIEGKAEEDREDTDGLITFADDDIASGADGNITWRIDADGKLTVSGTGDTSTPSWWPWSVYGDYIVSADLSGFDTSYVTNMSYMFKGCSNLTSLDLSGFKTSNVIDMKYMFSDCSSLINLDLSSFETSNVTDMEFMFDGCSSLISLDLVSFETSNVTDMGHMFCGCNSLSSLNLSSFATSNVTNMYAMFMGCRSLTSLDLNSFDVSNVTNMSYIFQWCSSLSSLDISNFATSNVTDMSHMFYECNSLSNLNISSFDTSNVTNMGGMFADCWNLGNLDLSNFDTSNVIIMDSLFYGCNSLSSLNLGSFATSNVTDMYGMFSGCRSLTSLDLSNFNTSNVTSMSHMFDDCRSMNRLNISNFDISNVINVESMFADCWNLSDLDLSNFDTSNVMSMYGTFMGCRSLTSLNLSSFDTSNTTNMSHIFDGCDSLSIIYTPYNVKVSVELPAESDAAWYLPDGTEITELPQNLDHSVMITRRRNPQIITTTQDLNMDDVVRVKYVPYSYTVETNNSEEDNKVTFSIEKGELAEGLQIYPATGEIYGVPLETGKFPITVKAEFSNPEYLPSYADLTLTVLDNTDGNVFGASDPGYEVEQYIGTQLSSDSDTYSGYTVTEDADQLFISAGAYSEFVDFWLNGQKLVDGEDYTKESGSTRITIRKQTLEDKADQNGTNTIAAEFRVDGDRNNDLKRTAQNFRIDIQQGDNGNEGNGNEGHNGGSGDSRGSSHSSRGQSEAVASNSATSVVRLVDRSGNPLPDTILELHSTPQEARTDQNGIAVFSVVESGAHVLYAKDGNGNVLASRNFELLFGDTVGINGDQLTVKAGAAFTLNVRVNGNALEFLSLQNGDIYQVIASATGDESSPEMWFLLSMLSVSAILGGVLYGRRRRHTVQ